MRIHVELLDANDLAIHDATFESPFVTIGGSETDDFVIPQLPARVLELSVRAGELEVLPRGGSPIAVRGTQSFVLGSHRLRVTTYPSASTEPVHEARCPRCAVLLRDATIGGAYRSFTRRERVCDACGGAVLDLEGAAQAIGPFADASRHDWVHVAVTLRCPRCTQSMTRARLSSAHGATTVERCIRCRLVFLEAADRARLRGEAR